MKRYTPLLTFLSVLAIAIMIFCFSAQSSTESTVVGILYAVTDEMHQMLVSGRVASVFDVLIDSVGVFCGVSVLMFIRSLFRRRKLHV